MTKEAAASELLSERRETQGRFVSRALERLGLNTDTAQLLLSSFRETTISIPLEVEQGGTRVLRTYTGHRVQHNHSRGPFKGGLRFHPTCNLDELRSLAQLMTWKTALVEIPFGGAKGCIAVDPKSLSTHELETLTKRFTQKLMPILGVHEDVMAPDVGTNPQVMAWILDEYSKSFGYTPAVVTGKPLELQGSPGRLEATGHGVAVIARQAAGDLSLDVAGARVAIQGFGNVGYNAARVLAAAGARVIALSDSRSGVFNEAGIDVEVARAHSRRAGWLQGLAGAAPISNAELLELPCDILLPCAIEATIDSRNAERIKAPLVVEGANMPITYRADQVLRERGVRVVPDLIANAGGVLTSYYEWVQNLQEFPWERAAVMERLETRLLEVYHQVRDLARAEEVDLRTVAYQIAIRRVARALTLRGF